MANKEKKIIGDYLQDRFLNKLATYKVATVR